MEKTIIDCGTGRTRTQPYSAAEVLQAQADYTAFEEQRLADEATRQLRAQAIARLKASTNPEIAQLVKLLFP